MARPQLALLVGLLCAVVFGYFVARSSSQRVKIHGGIWAQIFHYIGAAAVVGILPMVLICLVLGLGIRTAFPLALTFLLTGWVALLVYAALERSTRAKLTADDKGWTREDARQSY